MTVMNISEIKSMAVKLSKDYGIKLSMSDKFNALPMRYQTMVRKEVYKLQINTNIE
jgi:hypothetical protein